MTVEPELALALSMYASKGAYALLLGSGISASSGVPVANGVVEGLIRQIATLAGQETGDDAIGWYRKTYGDQADYSPILAALEPYQTGRSQLLRPLFEPTEEDREAGRKVPTDAHRAIADLASRGHVRVILTTNFDNLIETALAARSVPYQVVASVDDIGGMLPLVHGRCSVIKLHGDYRDVRTRNTEDELAGYEPEFDQLLDQVLDEYGLVVCGWSATGDIALRNAIARCTSQRFGTYWTVRREMAPDNPAYSVVLARGARTITITTADGFFQDLAEKVASLERSLGQVPLTAKVASETVKKLVSEERFRVRLGDLVLQESRRVYEGLPDHGAHVNGTLLGEVGLRQRITLYTTLLEKLRAMLIAGCYWGTERDLRLWVNALEHFADIPGEAHGYKTRPELRLFPALLLMYAGGIAAVAGDQYGTLAALLLTARGREMTPNGPAFVSLASALRASSVVDPYAATWAYGGQAQDVPTSAFLRPILRPEMTDILSRDDRFDTCFDRFEYFHSLVAADVVERSGRHYSAPLGRLFQLRVGWQDERDRAMRELDEEAARGGDGWPPLLAGLFDGSLERFQAVKQRFDAYAKDRER